MTDSNDPFSQVLQQLGDSVSTVAVLNAPLNTASTVVGTLDDTLRAVGDIEQVFDAIDDILEGVDAILAMLSPIPVVGEVADSFEGITTSVTEALTNLRTTFDDLNNSIIKPVTQVLDDVKTGLTDVRTVVTDVSVTVPQYINTVNILSYLLDIAQPLTQVLQGTDPGDRLNKVVSQLNQVKDDVGNALAPLSEGLAAIAKGVQYFAGEIKKALDNLGDGAKEAIQGLQAIAAAFSPIVNAFKKAENAIAPVRWVLEAISFLVNKILMPVIKWIMKVTGLQSLVDDVEKWVMQKLGISGIATLVQGNLNPNDVQSQQNNVGSQQGSTALVAFTDLGKALGNYRNNQSGALKDATFGLVTAITGTPIDPNRVVPLPPWPPVPPLSGNSSGNANAPATASFVQATGGLQAKFDAVLAVHSKQAKTLAVPPLVLSRVLVQTAGDDTGPDLPPVDPAAWPRSAALIAAVQGLIGDVEKLSADAQTLSASLAGFRASLSLPADFNAQVADVATVLHTCNDLAGFLSEFGVDFINKLVAPVEAVITGQLQDVALVTSAVPDLVQAVQLLGSSADSVIAAMPQTSVIDDTVNRLDGWVLGLQQLVALMNNADQMNEQPGNQYTSELADLKARIEAGAVDLSGKLTAIDAQVQAASQSVESLQKALDDYSTALTGLSQHSQAISANALPALHNAAGIMGKIDSIFDPLSSLLKAEQCIDAGNPAKVGAAAAIAMIKTAGQTSAAPPPGTLTTLAQQFGEQVLPMGQIASAATQATTVISGSVITAFQSQSAPLSQALSGLSASLQQTKSYEITNKDGTTSSLSNDLVDQAFVDQAKSILSKMTASQPV